MAEAPSYIDYEAFLDPSFSPYHFANTLVLTTNNPTDTPIDLSTPLSRVLFDVQEIDTHIHSLTTKSAIPLLEHTKADAEASERILGDVDAQVHSLTEGYRRLEKEVLSRYEAAEKTKIVTERLWKAVKIGRSVARCVAFGRQLEVQVGEVSTSSSTRKEDHRAMPRACTTLLSLRQLLAADGPGEEGEELKRIHVITTLQNDLVEPAERKLTVKAQQVVREFSLSSLTSTNASQTAASFSQTQDIQARTTSALQTLYLLSPASRHPTLDTFAPTLLLNALQAYLQNNHTSSVNSIARALSSLPSLDRTLLEVSARCQNIIALARLLEATKPPAHPYFTATSPGTNLLAPLLQALDTTSLTSNFWRSLASSLSPRVHELVNRGGPIARALKSNRDRVRDDIRECVLRGSQAPAAAGKAKTEVRGGWEREVAVMVGAVVGHLGW